MQKYRTVGEIVYAENLRPSDFVGEHMLNKSIHDDEDFDEADWGGGAGRDFNGLEMAGMV